MNSKFRTRAFWLFASALAVAIAAVVSIAFLRWQAEETRRTQRTLGLLLTETRHSEGLAWRAIVETSITPSLRVDADVSRHVVSRLLSRLPEDGPGLDRNRLGTLLSRYFDALEDDFALVERGKLADAAGLTRHQVGRTYRTLDSALAAAYDRYDTLSERRIRTADLGSALVALATIVLLGYLLRTFDSTRRAVERAETEKVAIEASEEHFRDLVQNSSDVTMILTPAGDISYVSASAGKVLGCPADQLADAPISRHAHPDDVERVGSWLAECIERPGGTPTVEFRFRHSEDKWRYVEAIGNSRVDTPSVGGVVANVRDVTERRRTEDQLAAQGIELEEQNSELTALQQVSEVASRTTSMDELLGQVLETITQIGMFQDCRVGGILVAEGERLRLASYIGDPTSEFIRSHEDLRFGECLCGIAAQTGELIVSDNCDNDERHTIRYPGMTPHGHVIAPLRVMDQVVGVLYFYVPVGTTIDDRMRQTLVAVGDQVGTAIENVRLYEQTKELSLHDPLTGLANRRLMQIALQENFARARRLGRQFSVIMMDLDLFKDYNDRYGHAAGDRLLAEVANLVLTEVREIDLVVRFGGEEFLVILPEAKTHDAVEVAERIRGRIIGADFFHAQDMPPSHITISLGVAAYRESVTTDAELLSMADQAMYAAKRFGRNRVEVYPG